MGQENQRGREGQNRWLPIHTRCREEEIRNKMHMIDVKRGIRKKS
jgi:hypothetical protein